MALDRDNILKTDFPIGRRGYEPEAVDAHLSAIAAEVAELASTAGQGGGSLAATASNQVRAVVEAAESMAVEIRSEAEQESQRLRAAAEGEAQRLREEAEGEAQRLREEGETEAERLRAEAESAAQQLQVGAEGDAQQLRSQAEGEAQQLRSRVEGEAQQLRAQVEGEAQQLRAQAEDEAQQLHAQAEEEAQRLRAEGNSEAQRVRVEAEAEAQRLKEQAENEAERIRAEVNNLARAAQERAKAQTRELVEKMSASASAVLAQIEAIEQELGTVVVRLRSGAATVAGDLEALKLAVSQPDESDWELVSEDPALVAGDSEGLAEDPEPVADEPQPEPEAVAEATPVSDLEGVSNESEVPSATEFEVSSIEVSSNGAVPSELETETAEASAEERKLEVVAGLTIDTGPEASEDSAEPWASIPPPHEPERNGAPAPYLTPVPSLRVEAVRDVDPVEAEMFDSGGVDAEGALRFEQVQPKVSAAGPAAGSAEPNAEGARLIALNMALNGSSREEVDHYLDENFTLANRAALLDEVYASVDG